MPRLGLGIGLRCRPPKSTPNFIGNPWELITPLASRTMAVNDTVVPSNQILGQHVGAPIYIPPGATQAHIKLTYSEVATTTAYAYLVHKTNPSYNVGFNGVTDISFSGEYHYWRPGDAADLWLTVNIDVPSNNDGDTFQVNIKGAGWQETIGVLVQVQTGAVNQLPAQMPFHRPRKRLVLGGATPSISLDIPNMVFADDGDATPGAWETHPAGRYTNYSNAEEVGAYAGDESHPNDALLPHRIEVDSYGRDVLRLSTRRLPSPIQISGIDFNFQASMIHGRNVPGWCNRNGMYRALIATPSRYGAWSAFWGVGKAANGATMWPPEIDFFESFNGAYDAAYTPRSTSSAQHVGDHGSDTRFQANGLKTELDLSGFDPALDLNYEIHDYACLIRHDYLYHFVDGIETMCHRNMTAAANGSVNWSLIPYLNVAIRMGDDTAAAAALPYNDGSGDLLLYGMEYYSLHAAYSLEDYTAAKPYPNGKITPDPAFPSDVWNKTPNIALHLSTAQAETIKATGEDAKTWISLDTTSNTAHQSDLAKQPRWGSHTINSVPALKFSEANSDHMQLVAPIDTSNGVTAVFVFRKESGSVNRPLLGGSAAGSLTLRVNSSGRLEVVRTSEAVLLTGTTFINTTTDYLVAFRVSDTKIQIYINGTLEAETDDDPALTAPSEFIGKAGSSFYFDGPIGFAHVNAGHLSDADLDAVAGVAAAEFGLTWNNLVASATAPASFVSGDWDLDDPGTDGDLDVVISSLPANNGAAITDIEFRIDGGTWQSSGGIVDFGITGLNNGQFYSVEIRAVNSVGPGPASDTKNQDPSAPATGDYSMAVVNINSGQYYGFTTNGPQGSITPATASSGDVISNILVSTTGAILMKFGSGVQPNGASTIDLEFADLATTVTLNWVSGNSRYELSGQTAIRTYLEGQAGNSIPLNVNGIPTGSTSPFTTGFDAGFGT